MLYAKAIVLESLELGVLIDQNTGHLIKTLDIKNPMNRDLKCLLSRAAKDEGFSLTGYEVRAKKEVVA